MKYTLLYSLFLLVLVACQQTLTPDVPRDEISFGLNEDGLVKGEIYVKFKNLDEDLQVLTTRSGGIEMDDRELNEAVTRVNAREMCRVFPYAGKYEARTRKAGLHLWYKVKFDEKINVGRALEAFSGISNVAAAEPVGEMVANSVNPPLNQYFGQQWYLHNTGENGMMAGADIGILDAWELTSGSSDVIVAVIDQIVDFRHFCFSQAMWRNDEEDESGYYDQDGNGYVGDYYGLGANEGTFRQEESHGTHVAGIIAAGTVTNPYTNPMGIAGIAGGGYPQYTAGVRIMTCDSRYAVEAIKYAADMGAVICNNSYSVNARSQQVFQEAVNYFVEYAGCDERGNKREDSPMKGGIVIASAGNDNTCPDVYVPASLEHVISVASINPRLEKSSFSNYAPWVTVSAFGGGGEETPAGQDWGILSTMNSYGFASQVGTSMAAPVVSGVAALLVSYLSQDNPELTAEEVKYRLLQNAIPLDEYNPEYEGLLGAGYVHAYAALTGEMNWPPTVVPVAGTPDLKVENPVYYGDQVSYVFDVADRESGVTYTVEDPSGAFTHEMKDGKLTFSLVNRDCQPGSYTISFTVTDKGLGDEGRRVQATTRAFSVRLLPEVRTEVGVENDNETLTVRASTTFSGTVTVFIYDANGNLVQKQETETSLSVPGVLDISGLDGGTYTVKLTCNNKTITKNIIKL